MSETAVTGTFVPEQNSQAQITPSDFQPNGLIKDSKDIALVVQSASQARAFIVNKQWSLMWR